MLRSFFSGVSGLRNHQQSMDVIGNNLANVNTVGFKSSRVTFEETLNQTIQGARSAGDELGGRNPMQVGLGMTVGAVDRNMTQGALQTTGNSLDMAIEGLGFFIVGQEDSFFYTRNGALAVDDDFNLVTNTGDKVFGWVDTDTNGVIDTTRDELQYINLDRRGDGAITNAKASATPPVTGPNQGDARMETVTTESTTLTDKWTVTCTDAENGIFEIAGERNGDRGPITINQTWNDPDVGTLVINANSPSKATLNLDTDNDGTEMVLTAQEWGAGGNDIHMQMVNRGAHQALTVSVQGTSILVSLGTDAQGGVTSSEQDVVDAINNHPTAPDLVVASGGSAAAGSAAVTEERYLIGGGGPNEGDYFTFSTTAPGGAALESLTAAKDGTIIGIFENGTTEEIARVGLANVPNPAGLLAVGGGKFAESPSSGSGFPPNVAGTGGTGTVASGFLEMSNVDLTREFTDMIVTQRGFQANSRIITTSDEMLQDLLALKR